MLNHISVYLGDPTVNCSLSIFRRLMPSKWRRLKAKGGVEMMRKPIY